MVGKIFLYRISFTMVYNELGNNNMNNFEYFFLSQSSGKNIFLKPRWMSMNKHFVVIHNVIYLLNSSDY